MAVYSQDDDPSEPHLEGIGRVARRLGPFGERPPQTGQHLALDPAVGLVRPTMVCDCLGKRAIVPLTAPLAHALLGHTQAGIRALALRALVELEARP